jgi:hypothetical protein
MPPVETCVCGTPSLHAPWCPAREEVFDMSTTDDRPPEEAPEPPPEETPEAPPEEDDGETYATPQ